MIMEVGEALARASSVAGCHVTAGDVFRSKVAARIDVSSPRCDTMTRRRVVGSRRNRENSDRYVRMHVAVPKHDKKENKRAKKTKDDEKSSGKADEPQLGEPAVYRLRRRLRLEKRHDGIYVAILHDAQMRLAIYAGSFSISDRILSF